MSNKMEKSSYPSYRDGEINAISGGHAELIASCYGVNVYCCRVDNDIEHIWLTNSINPGKIIGDSGTVKWRGIKAQENYGIVSAGTGARGIADFDKIISRGIALRLAECDDLENLISDIPTEIWVQFPKLLPFIIKYNRELRSCVNNTTKYIEKSRDLTYEVSRSDFSSTLSDESSQQVD